jgi:hypothetical protein
MIEEKIQRNSQKKEKTQWNFDQIDVLNDEEDMTQNPPSLEPSNNPETDFYFSITKELISFERLIATQKDNLGINSLVPVKLR